MNNRVKSLKIRNEVINLIESKFDGVRFIYSYNDLYKIKDNGLVRRLKGSLYKRKDIDKFWFDSNENEVFNNLIIEVNNYLNNLNYKGFEIRLKKKGIEISERDRNYFEERNNIVINMKEYKKYRIESERDVILSIRFKDK
jgi:hypothetical protein